jgi:hypothetical protein
MNQPIDRLPRRTCGAAEAHYHRLRTDPRYRSQREEIDRFAREFIAAKGGNLLRSGVAVIPVVVHVVYNTAAQNISDAQIQSQIDVLNADFRRLNTDIGSVPGVFQPFTADLRIEFRLAARDPDCNPTTGITRTSTSVAAFTFDYTSDTTPAGTPVKFASQGGHDAWPADRYLNIWACNLSGGLLGYATFPGYPANVDGVVVDYQAFGTTGTAAAPFNLGRTATHEIGHYLDLFHIWGDDGTACTGTDEVADTPNQGGPNYGCPSFPKISCSNGPNGDMFMNYMDYTDDACMVMYTAGQSARANATLNGVRAALLGSQSAVPPLTAAAVDLWAQNTPLDIGDEPDLTSTVMWDSDDIWVRNQNDGTTNQEHQNPEHRTAGGAPNYVYVRIRNRGCSSAGTATVKLYWAKASSGLSWPAPWDGSVTSPALMGGAIGTLPSGSVAAGGFVILAFPWMPPDPADYASFGADQAHFCLLARIETSTTSPYGMTVPETSNLYANVRNNNNIVWKNVTVVDNVPGTGKFADVIVGNFSERTALHRLVLAYDDEKGAGLEPPLVHVTLPRELAARVSPNLTAVGPGNTFVLEEKEMVLQDVEFGPGEVFPVRLQLEAPPTRGPQATVRRVRVRQYAAGGGEERLVGGVTFVLRTPPAPAPQTALPEPGTDAGGASGCLTAPLRALRDFFRRLRR